MLSKKSIAALAKLAKVDEKLITDAIAADKETDVAIPDDVESFTKDELTSRDTNNQTIGKKEGEKEGEVKGKELAVKALKKKVGIDDANLKDVDGVGDKVVEMMKGDQALKDQVTLLTKDKQKLEKEVLKRDKQLEEQGEISSIQSALPKKLSDALTTSEHAELVAKNIKKVDGGFAYDGEILRNDKDKSPMTRQQAYEWYYTTHKSGLLVKDGGTPTPGRGGGDDGGNGGAVKTLKDVQTAWLAKNPNGNLGSVEFSEHVEKVITEVPDLDFNIAMD